MNMKYKGGSEMTKTTYITLVSLLISGQIAHAQESGLEVFALPEVVVTATRTSMDKKDVSSAVEVITQEDIKARDAHTLKDVLSSVAGVNIMRSNGRDAISIRGFDSRFSMILIDGKRISSEIDQNYELDRISLENVERIEIVRGPASSLYGTDALGGVINIITKQSVEEAFYLGADYGRFAAGNGEKNNYNFVYDSGKQEKYGFVISGSHSENHAAFKSDSTTYSPYGVRQNMSSRIDYQPTADETFTFMSSYMTEDVKERVFKQTAKGQVKTDWHDDNDRRDSSLSYKKTQNGNDLFFRAYQSIYNKTNDLHNSLNNQLMNYGQARRTVSGFEGRISKNAGENHLLTIGGEYRPERFRGTAVRTGEGKFTVVHEGKSYEGSEAKIDYSALYVEDQWKMSPKLLAVTSLRYDASNRFESNVSPKIGLTYKPEDNLRLKLNVSKGFRSPTPNQLYVNSSVTRNGQAVTLLGNETLNSEKSTSYDVSIERDFGKATSKITYFSNKITDMIEEVYTDATTVQYQNINKATIQGLEAEVVYPLSAKFSWSANYTYLDAVNDMTNERLLNRARHKLASRLSYNDHQGLQANLWAEVSDGYLLESNSNKGNNKSYTLWNLNVEKTMSKNSTFTIGLDNLLNKQDDDLSLQGTYIHSSLHFKL